MYVTHHRAGSLSLCWMTCLFICCLLITPPTQGQIVSDVTGVIDLQLGDREETSENQYEVVPVSLSDADVSIDGTGYPWVGGYSEIYYNVLEAGAAQTWFMVNAIAESMEISGLGRGHALLDVNLTIPAPFYYRLEADETEGRSMHYGVSFNGVSADAGTDPINGWPDGTFPLIYFVEPPDVGWPVAYDTYVDEGFLPAGVYQFTVRADAGLNRYADPFNSSGIASLLIQLQGDANLDGFIGLDDLDAVLQHWNNQVPAGQVQFGDLTLDGFVGLDDLDKVLSLWNLDMQPPGLAVPEPASLGLSLVFTCLLLRRSGA